MERPYTDTIEDNSCVIREFDENIDPIELMWHRDNFYTSTVYVKYQILRCSSL